MDKRFLDIMCDSYLIDNDVYRKFNTEEVNLIKTKISDEIIEMIQELKENDIELYDMIYDKDKVTQSIIIKQYLDYTFGDEESINESLMVVGGMMTAIAVYLFSGTLSKLAMQTAAVIGRKMEDIGKAITTRGRYWKFRYAIIQKNIEKCYTSCKVDPKEVSAFSYIGVQNDVAIGSIKGKKQGVCLAECYIASVIESIGLLLQIYFMCLKKTGNFEDISSSSADDVLKIISGLNLGAACAEYYKEVKSGFDNFYDLLDFVYGDQDGLKQEKIMRLKEVVIKRRTDVKNFKDNKPQNFNSNFRRS